MPKPFTFSLAEGRALRKEYEQGISLRDLAAKHGVSMNVMGRALKRAGTTMRAPGYHPSSYNARMQNKIMNRLLNLQSGGEMTTSTEVEPGPEPILVVNDEPEEALPDEALPTLTQARENAGLTMRELGEMLGVHSGYISKLEHGQRPLNPERRQELVDLLGEFANPVRLKGTDLVRKSNVLQTSLIRKEAEASVALDGETQTFETTSEFLAREADEAEAVAVAEEQKSVQQEIDETSDEAISTILQQGLQRPTNRHPSVQALMRWFEYGHLPPDLQPIVAPIAVVARAMVNSSVDSMELSAGLRKLLEAKDCFVRAAILTRER